MTCPVSILSFFKVSSSAHASAIPASIAVRISGLSFSASNDTVGRRSRWWRTDLAVPALREASGRTSERIQDIEELRRGPLLFSGQRRHEVDCGAGGGDGWFRNTDSGAA